MGTVVVFGGTGILGRECVYQVSIGKYSSYRSFSYEAGCFQALKSNNKVIVLARDPSKMLIPTGSGGSDADKPLVDPNLTVIKGDVTDQSTVDTVFKAADDITGVIVALGGKTKFVGPTMLTDGTRCIINSMKNLCKAKRIAVVTSIGTGDSERQAPLAFKALMYTVMRSIFADKNNQEKLFTSPTGPGNDLEYCIIRPGGLGLGPPTGVINVIDGQAGSIQRADVATFCLGAIADKSFAYIGKTPCISSVGGTGWRKEPEKGFDDIKTAE